MDQEGGIDHDVAADIGMNKRAKSFIPLTGGRCAPDGRWRTEER